MNKIEVSALTQGFIKSGHRTNVDTLVIGERGPVYGRHWMVVDHEGKFMLSDKYPKIALIQSSLNKGVLQISSSIANSRIEVPISDDGKRVTVEMFEGKKYEAVDDGKKVSLWLSDILGVDCRLVHMPEDSTRKDSAQIAKLDFADSWSLSLGSDASLADLNQRIEERGNKPVSRERFGHDVWVTGAEPYAEDEWAKIVVAGLSLIVFKPIVRCARTLVRREVSNPNELNKKDKEPLQTLHTYRKLEEKGKHSVVFGQKMAHKNTGVIHVGDEIEVKFYKGKPLLT